jgi:purine/pyrimidine-nucleoside phosphorylase
LPAFAGGFLTSTMEFPNVTALAKANVYFDGKVVSHTIRLADGTRKTLGIIFPGTYHFGTEAAERMDISDGACSVVLDGATEVKVCAAGSAFEVPAQSGFSITVADAPCQYVCSFLP